MSAFKIQKGINLSHWLSQVFGWSPMGSFITEDDIAELKAKGYDHVRLPIDEENLWDENGTEISFAFGRLVSCIEWCLKHDMRIVVDMHILRSHHFNAANNEGKIELWESADAQDNFIWMWEQLQNKLIGYPETHVAYELMNEPVAEDHESWNKLLARGLELIRKREPGRTIVIGSNYWQNPDTFPYLKLPEGSRNILLSCHLYEPLLFTHYKAYWLPTKHYNGQVSYPGKTISESDEAQFVGNADPSLIKMVAEKNKYFDKKTLEEYLMPAITKAKELGFSLYCSEFGCLPSVPRSQRLAYYRDIVSVFKDNGLAYCPWDYLGDFGIRKYNRNNYSKGDWDNELSDIFLT
jgi:endoglucanase